MLDERDRTILEKGHLFHFRFWLALLIALPVYLVICHYNVDERQVRTLDQNDLFLRELVTGFSLVALLLAWGFQRLMLSVRQPLTRLPGLISSRAVERYRTAFMMTQATAHSIALFGLALYYSGYAKPTLYLFTCLAALGQILFLPRSDELRRYACRHKEMAVHKS